MQKVRFRLGQFGLFKGLSHLIGPPCEPKVVPKCVLTLKNSLKGCLEMLFIL